LAIFPKISETSPIYIRKILVQKISKIFWKKQQKLLEKSTLILSCSRVFLVLASFQNCAAKKNSTVTHTKDFCEKNTGTLPDIVGNRQKKSGICEFSIFLSDL
jgi:hypothetical protein